ncbi:amino acid ABC transporter substrate-binding protein [Otariodibacter oris]|uniref:Cystine transport system substrate-binding protein n=1 Tax=Otariodibacter oris TaxID=1032623 RepID=A0A420XH59_9PAST|nr:amino acid ABC transporter substrate-binding protein [Otariodibacter oris]RKR72905.1 cystine transport system substrate-binding protein [Otariodibacter oris]
MKLFKKLALSTFAFAMIANVSAGPISDRIEQNKTLLVGTEGTYPPFTFHDSTGKLTGFDVEVIEEVAKRLGLKIEFQETQWDAMYAGLNAQRFDVIANQTNPSPERLKKYIYSDLYDYSNAVVVTREDDDSIKSFEDLKDKRAGQSLTSNYSKIATGNGAELVTVDGLAQALELIRQKRIDTTVNDKLAVLDYFQKIPNAGLKVAVEASDKVGSGFAFLKGEEDIVNKVNQALTEMRKDGTLKQISIKWFGDDITE